MLGLRHYKSLAIDLWQGNFLDFSCDALSLPIRAYSNYRDGPYQVFFDRYQSDFDFQKIISGIESQPELQPESQPESKKPPENLIPASKNILRLKMGEKFPINTCLFPLYGEFPILISLGLSLHHRHLAILPEDGKSEKMMEELKEKIDEMSNSSDIKHLKRISFLLSNKEQYETFQDALFSKFPD